ADRFPFLPSLGRRPEGRPSAIRGSPFAIRSPRRNARVKLDTMLVLGYLLLVGVIFIGVAHGSPQELWSPEALVVAFGGAMVATFAGLSMQELREAAQALRIAFTVVV